MNWPLVSSVVSALSGTAMIVSLIFVVIQLRLGVKNQQAMMQTSRVSRLVQLNLTAANPSFAEAWFKGMAGAEDLALAELAQFTHGCRATFANSEDAFYQHREGLLNDSAFASFVSTVKVSFASAGYWVQWRSSRDMYGAEFASFMDGHLAESQARPARDRLAEWKAAVAAEKRALTDKA